MDIITLSQYIVSEFSHQSPDGITPMKLQKLLYYIKVWTLIGGQDFIKADFEHWDYGPVNREIYDRYKEYGSKAISPIEPAVLNISDDRKELIEFIVENYVAFDAFKLSAMTHTEEPWQKTERNEIISDRLIDSYYRQQQFAKNFQPFDLLNNPFYPLDSYAFIMDMNQKDAQEITQYRTYKQYKNAVIQAGEDFEEQLSNFVFIQL